MINVVEGMTWDDLKLKTFGNIDDIIKLAKAWIIDESN